MAGHNRNRGKLLQNSQHLNEKSIIPLSKQISKCLAIRLCTHISRYYTPALAVLSNSEQNKIDFLWICLNSFPGIFVFQLDFSNGSVNQFMIHTIL